MHSRYARHRRHARYMRHRRSALSFASQLPGSVDVVQSKALHLEVSVTGGVAPYTYVWTKDGATLNGATQNEYSVQSAEAANAGKYVVTVKDSAGATIVSNECTVTVTPTTEA